MTDLIVSFIRQACTAVVGGAIAWASARWSWFSVDSVEVTTAVTAAVIWIYYVLVRALAAKWGQVGVLFGVNSRPQYAASAEPFEE